MINAIFTDIVNVKRRISSTTASRDTFNNPVYGDPTTWPIVLAGIRVRLAWSGKQMKVSNTGELIYPAGTLYYPKTFTLMPEDRIVTLNSAGEPNGIEYVVEAIYPAYIMHGVVDHYEGSVHLPI